MDHPNGRKDSWCRILICASVMVCLAGSAGCHRSKAESDPSAAQVLQPVFAFGDADEIDEAFREEIRKEFSVRIEEDQRIRKEVMRRSEQSGDMNAMDPELAAEMTRIDEGNTAWLKSICSRHGWIDAGRFGRASAGDAFLLVQHSGDLELMQAALPHIEADVREGSVHGGQYALLYDRVQIHLGRKQKYGSQVRYLEAGGVEPYPLEDPEKVDHYRAEMGLGPLSEYLKLFEQVPQDFRAD